MVTFQQQRPQQGGRQEQMAKTPRFADILDIAYSQHGLKRVATEIKQYPNEANKWTTIVHATVVTDRGEFSAIGDANPENAGKMIAPHAIRFAESRAIARALRWATNAGEALDVEMGDYAPEHPSVQQRPQQTTRPAQQRPANVDRDGVVAGATPAKADPMAALWGKVATAVQMLTVAGIKEFSVPTSGADQVTIETFLADARGALANAKASAK